LSATIILPKGLKGVFSWQDKETELTAGFQEIHR
jgi:hypothetical protein